MDWISTTQPKVAVLSVGPWASFGHPTDECVSRLHDAAVDCYWTEKGAGVEPDAKYDHIWGNITVTVADNGESFTVTGNGKSKSYQSWGDSKSIDKYV